MFNKKGKDIITIQVDGTEQRLIVRALVELKEKQKEENKHYEFLDDLIVKVCDANEPVKHGYEICK